jgi:phage gp45-like
VRPTKKLREVTEPFRAHVAGAIRKMAISLTSKALWQLTGSRLLDGSIETIPNGEPFLGVGFHARPSSSGKPEAIVLMVGDDATQPVVVAVRDEKTRQAIAGALAADETAMFNSLVIAIAKANGTYEIRTKDGTAIPLATKADIDALKTWAATHLHTAPGGGGPTTAPTVGPPSAAGTTVLKGE